MQWPECHLMIGGTAAKAIRAFVFQASVSLAFIYRGSCNNFPVAGERCIYPSIFSSNHKVAAFKPDHKIPTKLVQTTSMACLIELDISNQSFHCDDAQLELSGAGWRWNLQIWIWLATAIKPFSNPNRTPVWYVSYFFIPTWCRRCRVEVKKCGTSF